MATSIIVLMIDHDTWTAENGGEEFTPHELVRQGQFCNDDAAHIYGYEGWDTVFNVHPTLLDDVHSVGSAKNGPKPEEV